MRPTLLPPDFRWRMHASSWGAERTLHVRDTLVATIAELGEACYVSHRSSTNLASWTIMRADSPELGRVHVERWALANTRPLRLLSASAPSGRAAAPRVPHRSPSPPA